MQDDMKPTMMSGEMMDHSGMDMMKKDEAKMMKPTGYMYYDETKVSEALASGQKVALFFHATWCPSCKALDKAINSEISSIPSNALIVKVDYDSSTEMKKKYGVTSQHTTVIIDKDMNLISKKLGARNVGEVLN
jgi:thioredoxin 1